MDSEMQLIVNYNFEKVTMQKTSGFHRVCISPHELAFRLWNNFRWKGYIDPDLQYTQSTSTSYPEVKDELFQQLRHARGQGLQRPDKMAAARREFRRLAFQSLSRKHVDGLFRKYRLDFQMFDFSKEIEEFKDIIAS